MSAAQDLPAIPAVANYTREPELREVLPEGALIRPGRVYAYVLIHNIPKAEQRGFTLYPGLRSFTIYGQTCMLMVAGKATPGGRDTDTLVRPYVDQELRAPSAPHSDAPYSAPIESGPSKAPLDSVPVEATTDEVAANIVVTSASVGGSKAPARR